MFATLKGEMPDKFKRTITTAAGAAIKEIRIDLPDYIREAISENLERGRRVAQTEEERDEKEAPRSKRAAG